LTASAHRWRSGGVGLGGRGRAAGLWVGDGDLLGAEADPQGPEGGGLGGV
jgi:hypothetical protein